MQFFIDFHQGPPRTVWQGPDRRPLHKWPLLKSAAEIGGEEKRKEGKERVRGEEVLGRGVDIAWPDLLLILRDATAAASGPIGSQSGPGQESIRSDRPSYGCGFEFVREQSALPAFLLALLLLLLRLL